MANASVAKPTLKGMSQNGAPKSQIAPPIKRTSPPKKPAPRVSEKKRASMMITAGVMDFIGAIAGFVMVLVIVSLLIMLLSWLRGDIVHTFSSITESFSNAIITSDNAMIP